VEHLSDTNRSAVENIVNGIAGMCVKEERLRKITMTISGYDSDPRELYEIPEVCAWARETNRSQPGLWYFLDEDSQYRFIGWICGPASLKDIQSQEFLNRFDSQKIECAVKSTAAFADILEKAGASKSLISQFYFQELNKRAGASSVPDQKTIPQASAPTSQNSDEAKIIILCENCGQKLRLPLLSRRKRLRVTCPKCRYEFFFRYVPDDPRHYDHEHLRMGIVHQEIQNFKYDKPLIGPGIQKWDFLRSDPIYWDIDRPKTGKQKFTLVCPSCKAELVVELDSFEKMTKDRVRRRKLNRILRIIGAVICATSLLMWPIINFDLIPTWAHADFAYLYGLAFLPALMFFIGDESNQGVLGGNTELKMKPLDTQTAGHYIASIESQ
jgi:DNA-directed RNA polymerase subunit RPC12/RpoP